MTGQDQPFAQPLEGWQFRVHDTDAWQDITVPGCWENAGVPKDFAGPVTYRTVLRVPDTLEGKRLWLRFDGASYHAEVSVGGRRVGAHTGAWDVFTLEVTGFVQPGSEKELLVVVEKPARLTAGPDSDPVPGRFHTRETLSGFLPYVWGHLFGGLWQPVWLEATGRVHLEDVWVRGEADGTVYATVRTDAPSPVHLEILDDAGAVVAILETHCDLETSVQLQVPNPRAWSPHSPTQYTARITLPDGDARDVRFGLRTLEVRGTDIVLNGAPVYPRMVLNWGWYPESLHSNPGADRVRHDLERLKAMGFNGIKFCLWFPPQYFLDLCDELGMLVWLELPMWLTRLTPESRVQIPVEYARIVAQARNHPSIIIYTLGCELNRNVGADFLEPLYAQTKATIGDALLRDNSGSGEAYGGLLNEFADFYDYHFYCELHEFKPTVNHFAPRWRPVQPFLFGEYADSETWRDLRALEDTNGNLPWWCSSDPAVNPQGARWQYDVPFIPERAKANGMWVRGAELEAVSKKQSLLHRKHTLETTRLFQEIGGYVLTGEADTPISTAGLWDDRDVSKFTPDVFRAFNSDLVVLVGWDRRRAWIAGGDRAAPWDAHGYVGGALVRPHAVVSNYAAVSGHAVVNWSVNFEDEPAFASGTVSGARPINQGELREVGVIEFTLPGVTTPRRATLSLEAQVGGLHSSNAWPLWVYPADPWHGIQDVALLDPERRLEGLRKLAPHLLSDVREARVAVASAWTPELEAWIAGGGRAVVVASHATAAAGIETTALPFWREAVKLIEAHAAWGAFPHAGWCDLQFYGVAPDRALETAGLRVPFNPILRRVDARTAFVHDYAVDVGIGAGRAIVTTLNFSGGRGDQALGIERNPHGAFLLLEFVKSLLQP
jgi:hypothetical protein